MTDKLPEWVEQWITAKQFRTLKMTEVGSFEGQAVDVADLRAFLAKFVLCDRDPVLYTNGSGTTFYNPDDAALPTPLHAPATKEPE